MQIDIAKKLFLLERKSRGVVDRTVHEYELSINYFISNNNITTIDECTKQLISAWIVELSATKKAVTVNKYIRDIRAFLYYCMDQEYIKPYHIKTVRAQQQVDKFYTDAELQLLAHRPANDATYVEWRTWAMICFALGTGARLSTILNIHIDDIDWNNGSIYYRHTKNKKFAVVPLSASLRLYLQEFIIRYGINDGVLFPDVTGGQLTTNGAHRALEHYCENRNVDRHNWHSFRHSFSRTWVIQGGDIARLQVMLGHSSITQTQHYVALYGTDLRATDHLTALDNIKQPKKHIYK